MKYKKTIIFIVAILTAVILINIYRVQAEYTTQLFQPIDIENKSIIMDYYNYPYVIELLEKAFHSAGWKFIPLTYDETNRETPKPDSKYILKIPENSAWYGDKKFTANVTIQILERDTDFLVFTFSIDYTYNYFPFFPLDPNDESIYQKFEYELHKLNRK